MRRHTILFLAANPRGTPPLDVAAEARDLEVELDRNHGHRLVLMTRWAVTSFDVLRLIRKLKPTIVHFAGHGGKTGQLSSCTDCMGGRDVVIETEPGAPAQHGLFLHGPDGGAQLVPAEAIADVFRVVGASVKLVVLNACYSEPIVDALLPHVDCVVGMAGRIGDDAARAFTVGFYGALARGESVAAACVEGKTAIPLMVLNGLPDSKRPQLKARTGIDASRWVLPTDGVLRRGFRSLGVELRLCTHLIGALGPVATCTTLIAALLIAWRIWLGLGESTLDVRVQELTVSSPLPPPLVQDNAEVRDVEAHASIVAGPASAVAHPGAHRVTLTGAFTSIEFGVHGPDDAACRLRFAAQSGSIAIERATPRGEACRHDAIVIAGPGGLALALDGEPALAISAHDRVVLRMEPGAPLVLAPLHDRLALFWSAAVGAWRANRLEGNTAIGERARLPGALRCEDSFEVEGAVELRELRLDAGRLAVLGAMRDWHGVIGDEDHWNAAAPWPRALYCWLAAGLVTLLLLATFALARARWRAWEELG